MLLSSMPSFGWAACSAAIMSSWSQFDIIVDSCAPGTIPRSNCRHAAGYLGRAASSPTGALPTTSCTTPAFCLGLHLSPPKKITIRGLFSISFQAPSGSFSKTMFLLQACLVLKYPDWAVYASALDPLSNTCLARSAKSEYCDSRSGSASAKRRFLVDRSPDAANVGNVIGKLMSWLW